MTQPGNRLLLGVGVALLLIAVFSPLAVSMIEIVSFVAFAVMIAIVVNAMLDTQQQQVKNLFQNVQYCVDHPKDPACDLSVAPSP